MIRRTQRLDASAEQLETAAQLLRDGALVAFPTETVYGLGGDATNGLAVAGIYAAKGRPSFNPLIAHVPDLAVARVYGQFSPLAVQLAERFWPGPLTLVTPAEPGSPVSELATAGLATIALRVPACDIARELLRRVGRPVVAPSANLSGHVSPTSAAHVLADLDGRIDAIVDGGDAVVGVESTVVAVIGHVATLLRPGGVTRAALEAVIGAALQDPDVENAGTDPVRPASPGMLASHYAPNARVRLNAEDVRDGEALLTFGGHVPEGGAHAVQIIDLSRTGDLAEAAANLFGALRQLDMASVASIAVAPIPDVDLGEAINDRLRRAAAPR